MKLQQFTILSLSVIAIVGISAMLLFTIEKIKTNEIRNTGDAQDNAVVYVNLEDEMKSTEIKENQNRDVIDNELSEDKDGISLSDINSEGDIAPIIELNNISTEALSDNVIDPSNEVESENHIDAVSAASEVVDIEIEVSDGEIGYSSIDIISNTTGGGILVEPSEYDLYVEDVMSSIYDDYALEYLRADGQGEVIVDISFLNPYFENEKHNKYWVFRIAMNTHTFDINETNIISKIQISFNDQILDENLYEWVPDGEMNGHHVSGEILIKKNIDSNKVLSDSGDLNIRMLNVGDVEFREFNWQYDFEKGDNDE